MLGAHLYDGAPPTGGVQHRPPFLQQHPASALKIVQRCYNCFIPGACMDTDAAHLGEHVRDAMGLSAGTHHTIMCSKTSETPEQHIAQRESWTMCC